MNEIRRRDFLKIILGGLAALMTLILGGPLAGYVFEPFFQKKKEGFTKVPGFASVPENQVVYLTFGILEPDSFFYQKQIEGVWLVKHAPDKATVYSPICTHLSCRVDWQGDWQKFVCPCHGSVFNADGRVVSGPAPRSLDTLAATIEKGELYVQWKIYKSGIAHKEEI
jgi:Rieske Fe-S protein